MWFLLFIIMLSKCVSVESPETDLSFHVHLQKRKAFASIFLYLMELKGIFKSILWIVLAQQKSVCDLKHGRANFFFSIRAVNFNDAVTFIKSC